MSHYKLLRWAAGLTNALPDKLDIDEDLLIDLVNCHSLAGRFLQKFEISAPPVFTPKFKNVLRELHWQTRQLVMKNLKAACEVRKSLTPATDIVVIKGFSTFVLSGNESILRPGDIDILCSDNSALISVLIGMDYRQTRMPFMHEIGEYTNAGVEIDIHDYFPVYSYTAPMLSTDLIPARNPNLWQQYYTMKEHRITYDDLRKSAYHNHLRDGYDIVVADPNMLAIIICAHAFMNYTNMWSISHREKAYIRLGELADLFDLVSHPLFNKRRFLSLVRQFSATDAVQWATDVLSTQCGRNPLLFPTVTEIGEELPVGRYPRCLWWDFWAELPSGTDELLHKQWFHMDRLMHELGSNLLVAHAGSTGCFSTVAQKGNKLLRRYMTQRDPIPLMIEACVMTRGIVINLRTLSRNIPDVVRVRIDFGHLATEWVMSVRDEKHSTTGASASVSFQEDAIGYKVSLGYSWDALGTGVNGTKGIPILVGFREQYANMPDASMLIPIVLHF